MNIKNGIVYWIDLNNFDTRIDKSTYIEICNEFARKGRKIIYLTSYNKEKLIPEKALYTIKYLYAPKIPLLFRVLLIFRITLLLAKNLKPGDLIILQPNALAISIIAKIKGAKIHLDVRTLPIPEDKKSIKEILDYLIYWKLSMKFFLKKADTYSFITEALKREVEKEFQIKFIKYVIWTSAVNTELFKIFGGENYEPKNKKITLFYHGEISIMRGIPNLVRAVAYIFLNIRQDIQLMLIGDGNLKSIREMVEKEGWSEFITILGLQPYERIPVFINRADIGLCPLPDMIGWNVSSPLKIFEYLACGKPVICTPIPAHKDILGYMEGIIYSSGGDEKSLATAIIEALEKLEYLKTLSGDLRSFVLSKYTWEIQANALINHLEKNY